MSINDEIDGGGQEVYPIFPPQPKPPLAKRVRDFFETLFPNKLVLQLRADLDETRHERDYFKGRAERLELLLVSRRAPGLDPGGNSAPQPDRVHIGGTVGGRKTWQQVISDRRKELANAAKHAEGKKPAETSAPAKPAQN